jgi:hypothetical protein
MYESRHQPMLSRSRFLQRMAGHLVVAVGLVFVG